MYITTDWRTRRLIIRAPKADCQKFGHPDIRNMQGAAIEPQTGVLRTVEHAPRGGDEVNIERAGRGITAGRTPAMACIAAIGRFR